MKKQLLCISLLLSSCAYGYSPLREQATKVNTQAFFVVHQMFAVFQEVCRSSGVQQYKDGSINLNSIFKLPPEKLKKILAIACYICDTLKSSNIEDTILASKADTTRYYILCEFLTEVFRVSKEQK